QYAQDRMCSTSAGAGLESSITNFSSCSTGRQLSPGPSASRRIRSSEAPSFGIVAPFISSRATSARDDSLKLAACAHYVGFGATPIFQAEKSRNRVERQFIDVVQRHHFGLSFVERFLHQLP